MSQSSQYTLNIQQNQADFTLEPLNEQPPLFKFQYLLKTLDPPKSNPEDLLGY